MTGELCLFTEQLAVVNYAMSPPKSDVPGVNQFLSEFAVRGNAVRDGSDLPRLGRAQKISWLAMPHAERRAALPSAGSDGRVRLHERPADHPATVPAVLQKDYDTGA